MEFKKMEKKKKGNQVKVWPIAVCLVLAVGAFAFLLSVEQKMLDNYEKGMVVVALQEVPDNTEITEGNIADYFTIEERTQTEIPAAAVSDIHDLPGMYAEGSIDAGSIVTKSMLGAFQPLASDVVLLGIDMEALDQSVAGTLRAGDIIDIYTVRSELDEEVEVKKVLSGVVIERSYTGSGVGILKEDTNSIAQYITIPIYKEAVDAFYTALENKKIEIVKHPE